MTIDALSASNAYRNQLKLAQESSGGTEDTEGSGGSFAQLMQNALSEVTNTQMQSEKLQMQSLTTGKVELSELVTAVTNAELSLNTVVAVRDRVINAYQDIIKMTI